MATDHDFRIVFEEDGYPRELINAAERARAVREGALTPDMDVTVYRADATPGVFKARDIEELKPLFGFDPPVAPPPLPEPAGEDPAPAPPLPQQEPAPVAAPGGQPPVAEPSPATRDWIANASVEPAGTGQRLWPAPAEEEVRPEPAAPAPSPAAREPGKYTFLWVLIGIIVLLYVLGTCATRPTVQTGTPADRTRDEPLLANDVAAASPAEETGPAEVTAAEMASSVIRYAVRETNVRRRPTTASPVVGRLDRGASVSGVDVPGANPDHRWFKITSGEFAGYFVSADANVSEAERPPLDTSFAGPRPVRRYAPLYAEADRSSRILEYAEPGTSLSVVGVVADGLTEISLKSGAIAYVDRSAFEAPADPDAASEEGTSEAPKNSSAYPTQHSDLSRSATLRNKDLISMSDYPAKSLRDNDTGTVSFRVEVTASGRPGRCRITRSSGHDRLDRATCRLVEERARFDPALDTDGEPMPGLFEASYTWRTN